MDDQNGGPQGPQQPARPYDAGAARFRAVVDGFGDPILILDAYLIVRYVNAAFLSALGYGPADVIGRPFDDLLPPGERAAAVAAIRRRDPGGAVRFEHRLLTSAGAPEVVTTSANTLSDPSGQHTIILHMQVITARKAVEAALEAERASLTRRVEERTADLRRVNAELLRAVRAKDEFLATMSHELRTPLNTILALSEMLREQYRGPLNEDQQAALRNIEDSGRHLLTLINDILDLSKVEAGRLALDVDRVPLFEICEVSLMFVRELAVRKRLQLSSTLNDPEAEIEADPKRLKQMLVNLLANAVKFTPEGGQVGLEVEVRPEAGRVRFSVWDTGIGIAREDQERLFQPFTQLEAGVGRHQEGTGLGLALVLRLAELQGGSVRVESEPGRGSRFTFVLPLRAYGVPARAPDPAEPAAPPPPRPLVAPGQGRVLIAEDNERAAAVTALYLRDHGYEVVVARTGRETLERAAEAPPHIILLDIHMPDLDGLQVARLLRADPRFAATPVVAVTALAMPGDRERVLAAGVDEYLTKPVSLAGLAATLRRLLAR